MCLTGIAKTLEWAKTASLEYFQLSLGRKQLTELLHLPEKFLLFAIWHLNSLVGSVEVLLCRSAPCFYTLYLTTNISRLLWK